MEQPTRIQYGAVTPKLGSVSKRLSFWVIGTYRDHEVKRLWMFAAELVVPVVEARFIRRLFRDQAVGIEYLV